MRLPALVVAALLLGCGGGGDGESADGGGGGGGGDAPALDQTPAEEGGGGGEEQAARDPMPVPVTPLVAADAGSYSWADGPNRLTLVHNSGKIFLLEASFTCVGENGCKVVQDFAKLTCNKAFEKGYFATVDQGIFTIAGVKSTDTLHGAVTGTQSFDLLYQLTPGMCCEASFPLTAVWSGSEACADYRQPDCNPYTDENCPEKLNCIFGAGDKPVCMVAGEKAVGEQCSTQGNCADGVCMGLEGDDGQHCYKYCQSANDCVYGAKCLELTGHKYKVCSLGADAYETCNLLKQDCELPTHGCFWSSSNINQPICMAAGKGVSGDSCEGSKDCQKGYDCIAGSVCRKLCNLTEGQEPVCDSIFAGCSNHYPSQNAGYCGE